MSLKEGLIRQTEDAINKVVQRRKLLEDELEQIRAEELEARELLQLIKVGQVVNQKRPGVGAYANRHTVDTVLTVISALPDEFDNVALADALQISRVGSLKWGKRMVSEGILEVTYAPPAGVKNPTRFRKVD